MGVDPSLKKLLRYEPLRYDPGEVRLQQQRGDTLSRPEIRIAEDKEAHRTRYVVKKYRDPKPAHVPVSEISANYHSSLLFNSNYFESSG